MCNFQTTIGYHLSGVVINLKLLVVLFLNYPRVGEALDIEHWLLIHVCNFIIQEVGKLSIKPSLGYIMNHRLAWGTTRERCSLNNNEQNTTQWPFNELRSSSRFWVWIAKKRLRCLLFKYLLNMLKKRRQRVDKDQYGLVKSTYSSNLMDLENL